MAYVFNVNASASIQLTYKLEKLSRSAFPMAVRGTLNAASFDVKKVTLQDSAKRNFIQRAPSFFRRFSSVEKAQGFDVNTMQSKVGMTDQGVVRAHTAVEHMVQQEEGGGIDEGLDYLKGSRGGSNARKVVRSNYYNKENIVKIRNIYNTKSRQRVGSLKTNFVASAFVALREKKRMSFRSSGNQKFTMQVTSIKKYKDGRIRINSKLMTVGREDKPIKIKATHFSREAAMRTLTKIPDFYAKEAAKQFAKVMK